MTRNQADNNPSNAELMAELTKLVSSNTDMFQKIDQLEKRFGLVEKLFEEVENLKKEVERLRKPQDGFKRFEVEQKKKSILVKGLGSRTKRKYETRQETYHEVNDFFMHLGLNLTLEDSGRSSLRILVALWSGCSSGLGMTSPRSSQNSKSTQMIA